ncbi:hypothetical protein GobsT_20820 [Gemmata obscuriglobus]|uniref:Tetratricopeptide repeat protein n=1 Tax=Gemmata obscuriglobus TaxID=114 RepID=A0A2Z3H7M5_9BACT|nr:hypothetical protein [Gemmata obscuriglobus]AWM39576.1 hypothetical protein C1280_22985 [Gemmata obscuriglobus]QEG27328.1 hypothetical protein GobsT_20820 [Gemmata obscuriglobus]VTS04171.1 hypothetical protein : [Gemmata obscuriglobus UQM 2246]
MRVALLFVLLGVVVGCESLHAPAPPSPPKQPPPVTAPVRVVGRPPEAPKTAVEVLRASATSAAPQDPPEEDQLALVAQCLERSDHLGAAGHLETYVNGHADQHLFRLQLAELYLQADRVTDARGHYERFAAAAQAGPPALYPHLVTAHIKLREIAMRSGDRFAEPFHRGVGLLLLVREQDGAKARDAAFCEELLCKALAALTEAKARKPGDARVLVYLAEVHERAGNRSAAGAERAAARSDVIGGELTGAERRPLLLRD